MRFYILPLYNWPDDKFDWAEVIVKAESEEDAYARAEPIINKALVDMGATPTAGWYLTYNESVCGARRPVRVWDEVAYINHGSNY